MRMMDFLSGSCREDIHFMPGETETEWLYSSGRQIPHSKMYMDRDR
jgi:hypothetical protein